MLTPTLSPFVNRAAVELDVRGGDPGHRGHRGLPPQELLDGRRDDRRVVDDPPTLVGVLGQVGDEALEGVGHRVQPGQDEQEADADDLVHGQPLAVDLGGEEQAQDVVLARRSPCAPSPPRRSSPRSAGPPPSGWPGSRRGRRRPGAGCRPSCSGTGRARTGAGPTSRRNTDDGRGTASSAANSHSPVSMNPSMSSLTSRAMSGSRRFIWRGAKIGSRSRRYLRCSGGSTCSGISGTDWPEVDGLHGRREFLGVLEDVLHGRSADDLGTERARPPPPRAAWARR